ncbi:hypothetical protein Tco_0964198, partial [Tanacetum coccineum]
TARTSANGEVELIATINGQEKTITEASLRRHLKLEDNGGIATLPNTEIFEQLALMGYETDSDKLTFQKGHFSPQWRFFIHTILHCLSPKKTTWEQFSSNIGTAIICLATNGTFNFSKLIFDAMVKNVDSTYKFLMYPRFIQICLNKQNRHILPHTKTYIAHSLANKVFSDMKRVSRGYSGEDFPLFPTMITTPETSPSRITSSPSLSLEPSISPQTHQLPPSPQPLHTTHDIEEPASMPHDSPLQSVHSLECDEGSMQQNELKNLVTKLTDRVAVLENDLQQTKKLYSSVITKLKLRVKKLEKQAKTTKDRKRARLVVSEDEDAPKDSSKQGTKIFEIDEALTISLVQDKGMTWVQEDAEIQEKNSADTEIFLQDEEPTELVEDRGSGEKGEPEVSTVNVPISNASATPEVTTAAANLVLGHEEAIRLQEQINEEERQRIARDAEIAKRLQEEIDIAEKKEYVAKVDHAHVIDWNDPSVIRYHALQNRPRSVAEVRKNMCIYLKNQGGYKMSDFKGMSYDDIRPIFEKKIIRVGNHTEVYQVFEDMLKIFDNNDLVKLWSLVQERFNSHGLTEDKEKELWVELKM